MYLQRLPTFELLKNMPFFYILYILIQKILKILYFWAKTSWGRTGKGPKPLAFVALMHIYVWEHIVSLYYRTAWWMFTNLVGIKYTWPSICIKVFRPYLPKGGSRAGQKKVAGGPLLKKTYSSDWKATATNRMHSNDLEACGMKCCFLFHSKVEFLTRSLYSGERQWPFGPLVFALRMEFGVTSTWELLKALDSPNL